MNNRKKKRRQIERLVRISFGLAVFMFLLIVIFICLPFGKNNDTEKNSGNTAYIEEQLTSIESARGEEDPEERPEENLEEENREEQSQEASVMGTAGTSVEEESNIEEETNIEEGTNERIHQIIDEMSLHEKVCQMMVVTPEALTSVERATVVGNTTKESLNCYPVGGIILFAQNLESEEQTSEMLSNYQQYSRDIKGIDLFLAVDEEGGKVARVAQKLGTTMLDPMYRYREQGTEAAYHNAAVIASDISKFGFNLDFAPVADVWSNPENKVIGERAYSDDFEEAAQLVAASVEGFHSESMMCTIKHFPGHGDTDQDSHTQSAYSYKTLEQLQVEEFSVFQAGIGAGADMVMVGHITLPEIDDLPASLSSVIITDILREQLGYQGVVITDSLAMKSLTDSYGNSEIAVMAVKAGNDLLLCQGGMKNMVNALEEAVQNGEIPEQRIDENVEHILRLKEKYGLLKKF